MPESKVLLGLHVGQPCLASVLDNHAAEAGKRGHKVRGSLLQSRFESFACAAWCLAPAGSKYFLKVRQPTQSTFVFPIMVGKAAAAEPSVARSELRAECARLELSRHGLKAALAQRLLHHYTTLDRASLREACVRWSLSLRGSKAEALQRLESKLGASAASVASCQQEEGGESEADPDWTDDPPLESPEAEPSSLASSPDVSAQVMTSRRVRRKTAHYSPARSDGSGPADDDPWDWKGIEVDSE